VEVTIKPPAARSEVVRDVRRLSRRAVIANETRARSEVLADMLHRFGYATEIASVRRHAPWEAGADIALVGRAGGDGRALEVIRAIVHGVATPVIVLLGAYDGSYVREAATAGAFGYVVGIDADELHGSIEIALARYGEYRGLQEAFARRALVERAKGVLMANRNVDEDKAFELLRGQARRSSRRVIDVAGAVLESRELLQSDTEPTEHPDGAVA
jgi:response regulator NasT